MNNKSFWNCFLRIGFFSSIVTMAIVACQTQWFQIPIQMLDRKYFPIPLPHSIPSIVALPAVLILVLAYCYFIGEYVSLGKKADKAKDPGTATERLFEAYFFVPASISLIVTGFVVTFLLTTNDFTFTAFAITGLVVVGLVLLGTSFTMESPYLKGIARHTSLTARPINACFWQAIVTFAITLVSTHSLALSLVIDATTLLALIIPLAILAILILAVYHAGCVMERFAEWFENITY